MNCSTWSFFRTTTGNSSRFPSETFVRVPLGICLGSPTEFSLKMPLKILPEVRPRNFPEVYLGIPSDVPSRLFLETPQAILPKGFQKLLLDLFKEFIWELILKLSRKELRKFRYKIFCWNFLRKFLLSSYISPVYVSRASTRNASGSSSKDSSKSVIRIYFRIFFFLNFSREFFLNFLQKFFQKFSKILPPRALPQSSLETVPC